MLGFWKSRLCGAVVALGFVASAQAALISGYAAGTGAHTAHVVVDFAFDGGNAYLFDYHFDGASVSVQDVMLALDTAGDGGSPDLDVTGNVGTFGLFVEGLAYHGESDAGDWVGEGTSWELFTAATAPLVSGDWSAAALGARDTLLADGQYAGWVLNVSPFSAFAPTSFTPSTVPEPAAFVLLGLGGVVFGLRRDRGQA